MEAIRIKWILMIWIACCGTLRGEQTVSLTWDPLLASNIVGYYIYYGQTSAWYHTKIDVTNQTAFTVSGLSNDVRYYFVVTAYDRDGLESDWSNEERFGPPPPIDIQLRFESNSVVRIGFPVVPGKAYELQSTQNLESWAPLWRTVGDSRGWAEIKLKYVGTAFSDRRFYRVVLR